MTSRLVLCTGSLFVQENHGFGSFVPLFWRNYCVTTTWQALKYSEAYSKPSLVGEVAWGHHHTSKCPQSVAVMNGRLGVRHMGGISEGCPWLRQWFSEWVGVCSQAGYCVLPAGGAVLRLPPPSCREPVLWLVTGTCPIGQVRQASCASGTELYRDPASLFQQINNWNFLAQL